MTTPTDIIRQAFNSMACQMHTCLPAEIVNYDYTKQKAQVKILLRKQLKDGQVYTYPEITNVPVMFPRANNFSIHYPLNSGDKVAIFFSERSLDEWLEKGGTVTPTDPRKFDISDAVAIPGLYPFSDSSPAEDNENFIIQIGSAKLKMAPDGTFCFHGVSEELMGIIDELFDAIESITVAADQGGAPNPAIPINNLASFTALQARFNTLKGDC